MTAGERGPNKRGVKSRDEIIDAAARMMSQRGYDGTSISDIARESGQPNSSIYWHFNSKAGILAAVMERGATRFFADVEPTPVGADETPEEHLRRALAEIGEVFRAHPDFLRLFILLLLGEQEPEITEIVRRVRDQGRESLRAQISSAFAPWGSDVSETISERTIDFALAGFDGAFLAFHSGTPELHKKLMAQLADSLIALANQERARAAGH